MPTLTSDEDRLKMQSFELALEQFIRFTGTPMTIAIQGEWGSGKTSLMNRLSENMCQGEKASFYSIWLNTWHYSLVDNPGTILADIINALIDEVIRISSEEHDEKMQKLIKDVKSVSKNVFRGLSHMAIKTAIPGISDEAVMEFDQTFFGDGPGKKFNLNDLRNRLRDLIAATLQKNQEKEISKNTFLFFIDDLDRIEPPVAVKILEMLKNIFDIEHCIFILAIDYEVVVKGLKPKFGELNAANEREFRSFFDKIIQLPFRMPVQAFQIEDYLRETLLSIDFISDKEADNNDFIQSLAELSRNSLGTNPRSLKRLANSLSFIGLLSKTTHPDQEKVTTSLNEKQISFALVCLQIAFPAIYNLLADRPDFPNWDEPFARKHQMASSSTDEQKEPTASGEFMHQWQKILIEAGKASPYLSKHIYNIIRIFHSMKQAADEAQQFVGDMIANAFEYASITTVRDAQKPTFEINPVRVYYALNDKLLPLLQSKLQPPLDSVDRSGRMIARIPYLYTAGEHATKILLALPVKHHNLTLKVGFQSELFYAENLHEDGWQNLADRGKAEMFQKQWADTTDLADQFPSFHQITLRQHALLSKKHKQLVECYFQTWVESVDHLYSGRFLEQLGDFITALATLGIRFNSGKW